MKSILLTEPNFNNTIKGSKTQTRRVGGLEFINIHADKVKFLWMETDPDVMGQNGDPLTWKGNYPCFDTSLIDWPHDVTYLKPRFQVGEIAYLKEPFILNKNLDNLAPLKVVGPTYSEYVYLDKDGHEWYNSEDGNWKPGRTRSKLFMPEKYARYFVKITGVRCERAYNLTFADILAEGVDCINGTEGIKKWQQLWDSTNAKKWDYNKTHKGWFIYPISKESIIPKPRHERTPIFRIDNPWVFVYEYELTDKPAL